MVMKEAVSRSPRRDGQWPTSVRGDASWRCENTFPIWVWTPRVHRRFLNNRALNCVQIFTQPLGRVFIGCFSSGCLSIVSPTSTFEEQ